MFIRFAHSKTFNIQLICFAIFFEYFVYATIRIITFKSTQFIEFVD